MTLKNMRGVRQSNVPPYTGYIFEEILCFVCFLFFLFFTDGFHLLFVNI